MRTEDNSNYEEKEARNKIPSYFQDFLELELEEYCETFMTVIQFTRCHICNKLNSCLPIHIPLITSHIFICANCLFLLAEQLDILGSMQEFIDAQIKTGKIREEGGKNNNVSLVFTEE